MRMMSVKLPRTVEEAEQLLEEAVQSCSLPRLNDALKRTHLAGKLCRPAQFTKAVAFRDHLVRVRMEGAPLLHRGELSFKSSEVGDLPQAALSPVLLKSKSLAITREDQDEAKCVVCLDSLRDREVTLLSCGHEFHKSCLEIFLKKADVACYRGAKFPCLLCDKIGQDGATVMGIPQDASVPLVRRDQSSEQVTSPLLLCMVNTCLTIIKFVFFRTAPLSSALTTHQFYTLCLDWNQEKRLLQNVIVFVFYRFLRAPIFLSQL